MESIREEKENKKRQYIMTYLLEKGVINSDEDVIWAEKAFKVNAVLRWCIDRKERKILSSSMAGKYFKMLDRFIRNEVDINWVKGNVKSITQKE